MAENSRDKARIRDVNTAHISWLGGHQALQTARSPCESFVGEVHRYKRMLLWQVHTHTTRENKHCKCTSHPTERILEQAHAQGHALQSVERSKQGTGLHVLDDTWVLVFLPSGRMLLMLRTVIRLLTSLLMLWATPGYCKTEWERAALRLDEPKEASCTGQDKNTFQL